jgi:hypothetical protein
MNWLIVKRDYPIWQQFSLRLEDDIDFACGAVYRIAGLNGSGKSSLIKKLLIPQLIQRPDQQYILYLEQNCHNQFDAVKSFALMNQDSHLLATPDDLLSYLFTRLIRCQQASPRPLMIIADEWHDLSQLLIWMDVIKLSPSCLILITHQEEVSIPFAIARPIRIESVSTCLSRVFL